LQTKNGLLTILDGVKDGPEKLGRNDVVLNFPAKKHQTQQNIQQDPEIV